MSDLLKEPKLSDSKELQPKNIQFIRVSLVVLKELISRDFNELQLSNI
nr:hypothetical protein [Marseilla massiliensis]